MNLMELILRLEHLAILIDNPADVQVLVYSDFYEDTNNIKLVDFDNSEEDAVYIII